MLGVPEPGRVSLAGFDHLVQGVLSDGLEDPVWSAGLGSKVTTDAPTSRPSRSRTSYRGGMSQDNSSAASYVNPS